MSLKILLISDDERAMQADKTYLKDRGLYVHTCLYTNIINDLVCEVKPDVIFINPTLPDNQSTDIYHSFLNDIRHLDIPIIYTMSEDDVYLINRKRTATKAKRNIIADPCISASAAWKNVIAWKISRLTTIYPRRNNSSKFSFLIVCYQFLNAALSRCKYFETGMVWM